jgi:8-oxo-dGTP diphosphatase
MKHNLETQTTDMVVGRCILPINGRYLMGLRGQDRSHEAGRWEHFGGRIEPAESPLDAISREVREETGLEVRAVPTRPVAFVFERDLRDGPGKHITVTHIMELCGGRLLERHQLEEHDEIRWLSRDEALELPLTLAAEASFYSVELMAPELQSVI